MAGKRLAFYDITLKDQIMDPVALLSIRYFDGTASCLNAPVLTGGLIKPKSTIAMRLCRIAHCGLQVGIGCMKPLTNRREA